MSNAKTACGIEALYRKYNGALYGFAYSIVRSHALAEDVVQDTFVRAISAMDEGRAEASLKSWLFVTARNLSVDCLRKESHSVGEEPLFLIPSGEEGAMEERSFLNEAMALLEPEEQQLWMLSAAGFRQREIAKRFDIPLGTVSWRFSEIKKKLRALAR